MPTDCTSLSPGLPRLAKSLVDFWLPYSSSPGLVVLDGEQWSNHSQTEKNLLSSTEELFHTSVLTDRTCGRECQARSSLNVQAFTTQTVTDSRVSILEG